MRVNHVGEVCAQALYTAQALATATRRCARISSRPPRRNDHLAWTRQRLDELGAARRCSIRSGMPAPSAWAWWPAGWATAVSLGFVVETERQVEAAPGQGHLERLPAGDHASRAIVAQMKDDEARTPPGQNAGAVELPAPVKALMRAARGHDDHRALHLAGLTVRLRRRSKLVVISAVLASMMVAEQYLSWLMAMARSTAAAGMPLPVTVKCMWILVNTFGSTGARSASASPSSRARRGGRA
jgi:ubiquinone biosynthesis monooxygenase Coq7